VPITLDRLRKVYPDQTVAVDELSLDIKAGEVVVLIGPSGCGKSTVLRMVNRLIEPTAGRVLLGGEDVTTVDPVRLRRTIGYVIQNVGLFPHQTVRTNVGTVPRLLGWDKARVAKRSEELLEQVGLDPGRFGGRYPHELSGGQRQRVGVARALAADPLVLLMDEPFSAVDPIVRGRLQEEFLRLRSTVRKTTIVVTHDLQEAIRLGDRIAVLSDHAHLEQYATPAELLAAPANAFVERFIGDDRGIMRLSVTPVPRTGLRPLSTVDDMPSVAVTATLREALAEMLATGHEQVVVRDGETALGALTAEDVRAALAEAQPG
jgi:osmoprotectant transport system ATP-binding protein